MPVRARAAPQLPHSRCCTAAAFGPRPVMAAPPPPIACSYKSVRHHDYFPHSFKARGCLSDWLGHSFSPGTSLRQSSPLLNRVVDPQRDLLSTFDCTFWCSANQKTAHTRSGTQLNEMARSSAALLALLALAVGSAVAETYFEEKFNDGELGGRRTEVVGGHCVSSRPCAASRGLDRTDLSPATQAPAAPALTRDHSPTSHTKT